MIELSWTTRAKPIVQVGIGASAVETGADARWDISTWGSPTALWSGDEPMWRDITAETHWVEPVLGRKRATDRFEPARMSVVVSNESGWADPVPLNDPDTLTLRAGRPIRWGVWHEVFGTVWKFRGYIDSVTPRYDPVHSAVVDISAVCALGEVGRATVPKVAAPVGANELAHARINRIATAVKWPTLMRDLDATSVTVLATEFGAQAADLMAETVDSLGGALFGDTQGRLALRNRNWQLYDPEVPVDGNIGQGITTHGYISFPGTNGNYASVPITTMVGDPKVEVRIELEHPTPPYAGGQAYAAGSHSPHWIYFQTTGAVNVYGAFVPAGVVAVTIPAATLAGQGYPGAASWVQWRSLWDPATDTQYAYWRLAGPDLADDAGWILAGSVVRAGNVINSAAVTWLLTGAASASFAMDGNVRRWMRWIDDALEVDIDASLDLEGIDPAATSFEATTGQTVTVFRSGSPSTELVPAVHDVWASKWTFSNARRDIVTRAVLGRTTDTEPFTYDDLAGQTLYGIEDYTATDLICTSTVQLDRLADRVLRTRGWETAERVEMVRIDASTSDRALDLVTLLDPFAPSRYRCSLVTDNGTVFDREMFATGVRHRMTRDEWIVEINLDVAEPWAIAGGRWGFAYWDESEWSPTG